MRIERKSNESLSNLVDPAARKEAIRRKAQDEFVHRGLTSIRKCVAACNGIPAADVIAKLKGRLFPPSRDAEGL